MYTEVVYNLREITDGICNRNTPRNIKMEVLSDLFNINSWTIMGFDSNGSKVRMKPKFHNIRDKKGRFKSIKKKK
jgi:hypothetical protein